MDAMKGIIENQGTTAGYAALTTGENFAAAFAAMEDAYMRARAADVKDIYIEPTEELLTTMTEKRSRRPCSRT